MAAEKRTRTQKEEPDFEQEETEGAEGEPQMDGSTQMGMEPQRKGHWAQKGLNNDANPPSLGAMADKGTKADLTEGMAANAPAGGR